jgi:hypothetical protein
MVWIPLEVQFIDALSTDACLFRCWCFLRPRATLSAKIFVELLMFHAFGRRVWHRSGVRTTETLFYAGPQLS